MTRRKIEYWVIPPQADAEFAANMEQVLTCIRNPTIRIVPSCAWTSSRCSWQGNPCRWRHEAASPAVDYERRAGTASVFLFSEPLAGWRQATARARRRKVAGRWRSPAVGRNDCEDHLGCDNLNTHTKGPSTKVRADPARQVRRIEFCHTPKHGSWLIAERAELDDAPMPARTPHRRPTLHGEVSAWSTDVNGTQRGWTGR